MTDAPERIFAHTPKPSEGTKCVISFTTPSEHYATEYVRADLAPAWQPIATAPKDGTEILIGGDHSYSGGVVMAAWGTRAGVTEFMDMEGDTYLSATHWMPLPTSPEGAV